MIYDCFIFFNEFDILKIRLRELYDSVDYFILIEASQTHTGNPKPLYYRDNKDLFKEYADKIIYKSIDFPLADTWGRENLQRYAIGDVLLNRATDDDIIISSDVDEIINRKVIDIYKHRADICCVEQKVYHYNLNCLLDTPTIDPKICRYKTMRKEGPVNLRYYHQAYQPYVIKDGGWHLSFMGGYDKIVEKIKAYAHYDETDPKVNVYLSKDNVEASIKNRKSLFLRDDVKYFRTVDFSDLPQYITENFQYFVDNKWIVEQH